MQDDLVEKYIKEENDKQGGLRELKLKKEEEARVQLMREVYESRANHMSHHNMVKAHDSNMVGEEKRFLDEALTLQER